MSLPTNRFVFYSIVIGQFCGTSVWFAGNAALPQFQSQYDWPASAVGYITSATLIGFIAGTLTFAMAGFADRLSPSRLFLLSSFLCSASSALCLLDLSSFPLILLSRSLMGFFLAGIYPVGMKIASDWNEKGLGNWLGSLVGALVLGTAFPHGLKILPGLIHGETLLVTVSVLAIFGGILIGYFVPDGPYRKKGTAFSFGGLSHVFTNHDFRIPAFGYFGHMWELYAFWAFIPWIINTYQSYAGVILPTFMPFVVIGSGALGCVLGGWWSQRVGSFRIALYALILSGLCCLVSPVMFQLTPTVFCIWVIFWGFTVVADSPQFSALVANNAPPDVKGSAITIVTCIGFSIAIISIQILNHLQHFYPPSYLILLLFPGPLLGVFAMISNKHKTRPPEGTMRGTQSVS